MQNCSKLARFFWRNLNQLKFIFFAWKNVFDIFDEDDFEENWTMEFSRLLLD